MHPERTAEGALDVADALDLVARRLLREPAVRSHVRLPARHGTTVDWPPWCDPRVVAAYRARGIERPWRHQVLTAELAHAGRHVLVATGTASGKSAAFGMPALTAALSDPAGPGRRGPTVLYVAPTKALAHDQLAGLAALGLDGLRMASMDGDTPQEARVWARTHARWVVTNPDMLHRTILPGHERWRGLLRDLAYVVVDEAHAYRGVFGAHVALVLRRLRRVARAHGAAPTFVLASATVAEPQVAAARLLGTEVAVVDVDDSSRGALELVLWDPSGSPAGGGTKAAAGSRHGSTGTLVQFPAAPGPSDPGLPGPDDTWRNPPRSDPADPDLVREDARGTLAEAAALMTRLVDGGIRTLTFARSRRAAEVIAAQVRGAPAREALVRAYRGGYLPEERRSLEADLRSGRLLGLAATNALELGIDVSGLDAVVLAGWPGTRASFWQQVGRAGRRGGTALAVLIPREDPLDRYVVEHPDVLTGRSVESSVTDPTNPYVLAGHLCAAAAEGPLLPDELAEWFGPSAGELCAMLAERGLLRRRRDGWYWTDSARPADLVDLRGTDGGPVRVVEAVTGRLLGTVDRSTAPATVHEGALYVHQGVSYEVESLDLDDRVATAANTATDLSTHARSTTQVLVSSTRRTAAWGDVTVSFGEVRVTHQVTSYLVRRWPGGQVLAEHPLDLPPTVMQTLALWWTIPDDVLAAAAVGVTNAAGALHALEHASIGLLPLFASCDRRDLGGVSTPRHPQTGVATIVVHDGHPGGVGFAERGFEQAADWLAATVATIETCRCADGCPGCVQSPACGNGNEPLDKAGALRLGRVLLALAPNGPAGR